MTSQQEPRGPQAEDEAHGATPPHGDPLGEPHEKTGAGGRDPIAGAPEDREDSATPPHGDPLR
jgi:hypothetical protein